MKKFIPKPGQIDFTFTRYAPTFNAVLVSDDKILIVKRSKQVGYYPETWNGISGFLDDDKDIESKISEEIAEELGFDERLIKSIKIGQPILQNAPEYQKVWLVVPARIEIESAEPKLNWEATEAKWLNQGEINALELMPGFAEILESALKL